MKHILSTLVLSTSCLLSSVVAADVIDWSLEYDGSVLPNQATPAWSLTQSTYNGASVADGVLTMELGAGVTGGAGVRYILDQASSPWDGSTATGSTLEFRMRVLESTGARSAGMVFISTGAKYFALNFREDMIFAGAGTPNPAVGVYDMDVTVFHTYRLVLAADHSSVSVYVDDNPSAVISGYVGSVYATGPTNQVAFGSTTSEANVAGITEWDYLNFTNAGAFALIPEPGQLALLIAGLCGGFVMAMRRRK